MGGDPQRVDSAGTPQGGIENLGRLRDTWGLSITEMLRTAWGMPSMERVQWLSLERKIEIYRDRERERA